ncbi:MAG: nitroreductase family protein [Nitrososphaerota archaeon]|nr:nitroreductase family protein [Nitrososphaerota archaeon]
MEFFDVIKRRRSVRAFKPDPIDDSQLNKILEAANSAPSAGNLQAYEIFLIKDMKRKRGLVRAALYQEFIAEAPVVLVFCANPLRSASRYGKRGAELYSLQDATIAATFAHLAATALGLASVWIGAFDDDMVLKELGNPPNLRPVAILPIGYAAEEPEATPRRSLEDLVHIVE